MKVYALKSTPELVEKSSSGGAFSKIAVTFAGKQDDNFSLYGAVWSENNEVKHVRTTQIEDITLFNGSKYAKSNIIGVYAEVESDLTNGRRVLFSGTPCQIYGLIRHLDIKNVKTDNLLTVDLICHGAPNPRILKDYIAWLEKKYKSKVASISFRDKSVGWKRYPTKILFENGKVLKKSYNAQLYIRMYFSLLILDKGCYSCQFSNLERMGDITLGDFWGIDKIVPEISAGKGVSLMIVNSQKGEKLVEMLENNCMDNEIMKQYVGSEFLKYQHNLNYATEKPDLYETFWADYNNYGFDYVVKKYKFNTLKGYIKYLVKSLLVNIDFFDKRLS